MRDSVCSFDISLQEYIEYQYSVMHGPEREESVILMPYIGEGGNTPE